MAQNIPPNFEKLLAMLQGGSYGKGMREVKPEERGSLGINPKDPNKFSVGPDGTLFSTMMGWSEKPQDLSKLLEGFKGNAGKPLEGPSPVPPMQKLPGQMPGGGLSGVLGMLGDSPDSPAPSRPGNMIPKVNKNGLQRMSPGVYRNKDGGLVRKVKG